MDLLLPIVLLLLGLALGFVIGLRSGTGTARAEARAAQAELAAAQALATGHEATATALQTRITDLERQVEQATGAARDSRERAETLQGQLNAQVRLDDLLKPIKDAVGTLQNQTVQAEAKRIESDTAIKEQIEALRTHNDSLLRETTRLAGALAKSGTRGQWGEAQLERLLEASGLIKGQHFRTQETRTSTEDPAQRPDVVVLLPGGGEVLVDAKVPFDRFIEACSATDPADQQRLFGAHAKDLLGHVKALSRKGYDKASPASPNFVVMFLPIESLLSSALEQEPTLLEQAFRDNVVLATPTSTLALLRTIAYGWSQDSAARNVREITELGAELHERLVKLVEYVAKVGSRIQQTAGAYNELVGTLERRVIVTARRIGEKAGRTERELDAIEAPDALAVSLRELPPVPRQALEAGDEAIDS